MGKVEAHNGEKAIRCTLYTADSSRMGRVKKHHKKQERAVRGSPIAGERKDPDFRVPSREADWFGGTALGTQGLSSWKKLFPSP